MRRAERVRRLVDGELDAAEREALLADARNDPELWRLLAETVGARSALRELDADERVEPGPELVDASVLGAVRRRHEALEEARARPWLHALTRPRQLRVSVTPLRVSVTVALAAAALLLWRPWADDGTSPERVRSGDPADRSVGEAEPPEREESMVSIAVRLLLPAEDAETVAVAGDFNGWRTDDTFLEDPDGDGVYSGTLELPPGTHAYMFVLDGERWVTDPYAQNHRDDGFGNRNAVLRIGEI